MKRQDCGTLLCILLSLNERSEKMDSANTTVIKIGGSMLENLAPLSQDIAEFLKTNPSRKVVLVHGGAAKTTEIAEKLGVRQKFVESASGFKSRFTDSQTLE